MFIFSVAVLVLSVSKHKNRVPTGKVTVKWKVKPFSTVAGKHGVLAATFKFVVDVIYAVRYSASSPLSLFSEAVLD